MSQAAAPFGALPTDVYGGKQKDLYFNDEPVVLLHQPAAHTDGDSLVFFRGSDVISTGDIFVTTSYPVDRSGTRRYHPGRDRCAESHHRSHSAGGSAGRRHAGHSGHGRICDEADVVEYRDMVTIIRDRIADMLKRGMTLDQVKAAHPTEDYDPRYGSSGKFVETVYRSLKK